MNPKFAYREIAARSSSSVGGVILLYEQAIQDVGGAIAAVASQDVELRTKKINHALLVIGQLQGSLDLDRGGQVGRNLDRFYSVVRARLMEAQFANSAMILREQLELLLSLRAAWVEVERAEASKDQTPAAAEAGSTPETPQVKPGSKWSA